jgi:hypothetical protein
MRNRGRGKEGQVDEVRARRAEEAWQQRRVARDHMPAPEMMTCYMDPSEGHDDFLMSIALVTEALASFVATPQSG